MKDIHLPPVSNPPPIVPEQAFLVTHYSGEPHFLFHYHPEFELTLTEGGSGRRLVGSKVSHYAGTDLVLLGPGLPHTWAAEKATEGAGPLDNTVLHFTRESLGLDFLARKELAPLRRLLERAAFGLHFCGPRAEEAARILRQLPEKKGLERIAGFFSLMHTLAACRDARRLLSSHYKPASSVTENQRLAQLLDFVNRHSARSITLEEAARHLGLSESSFTRFFRRATGKSFVDYLNDWRISRACALLEQSSLSVLQISLQCGFNNLSHFNRQFKRRCRVAPRKFRHRLRGAAR